MTPGVLMDMNSKMGYEKGTLIDSECTPYTEEHYKRFVRTRTKLCKDDRRWKTKLGWIRNQRIVCLRCQVFHTTGGTQAKTKRVTRRSTHSDKGQILGTQQRSKIMFQLRTPLVLDTRMVIREMLEFTQNMSRIGHDILEVTVQDIEDFSARKGLVNQHPLWSRHKPQTPQRRR